MMLGSAQPVRLSRSGERLETLSDALLALSIILAGASAFRIGGLPIGPGEAGLMSWIGLRAAHEIVLRTGPPSRPAQVMFVFWLVFAAAQCIGLMRSMSIDDIIDWHFVVHDIIAFIVVGLLSVLCLSLPNLPSRLRRITRYAMMFGCVSLTLQVGSAWDIVAIPGLDPWYWDRFRGWADNPNQLSLFCAILVPIALFGVETGRGITDRLIALGCAVAAFMAGAFTKGNSLRLALALGACCCAAIIVKRIFLPEPGRRTRAALPLVLMVAFVPILLVSAVPFVATLKTESIAEQVSRDSTETVNEAALRFLLWSEAFQRGVDSLYIGLGPGPHALVPLEIAVRQRWEPGANDPSLGDVAKHGAVMESHNTYLELFSQGGIPIVVAYVGLLAYAMSRSMLSRTLALPALLCVIASFGFFHVVLRHPIVWFGLCLCIGGADTASARRPARPA